MEPHQIVSRDEWVTARKALLAKEKAMTRARDTLAAERRALPWVKIDKEYVFEGPNGLVTLADLFRGRSQLFVYHFMFSPGWDEGCPGCSFVADHADGARLHLENHDVAFAAISRAALHKLEAYKARMEWKFPWVSSAGSDFNFDFHVSFTPEQVAGGSVNYNFEDHSHDVMEDLHGGSVFYKDANSDVFHTYSVYARGVEELVTAYDYLDMMPKGRNEKKNMGEWLKRHDRYETAEPKAAAGCCAAQSAAA